MPLEGVYQDPATGTGQLVPLLCDSAGRLIVVGAVGAGGGGASDTSPPATKEVVIASDGAALNLASLAQSIVRNTDGSVSYVEVAFGGSTYRQTLTYASGAVTGISAWAKQ